MSFYLHDSGLWCSILYSVYTSFGYHTILRPISKSYLTIKDFNKPPLNAKFQTNWHSFIHLVGRRLRCLQNGDTSEECDEDMAVNYADKKGAKSKFFRYFYR